MRAAGMVIALTLLCAPSTKAGPPKESGPASPFRFVNLAPEAGLTATVYAGGKTKDHILESTGSGVAFVDYDNDGWQDIYLVNGWALDEEPSRVRIRGRNVLYRNLGNGRFQDVTERTGAGDEGWGCGVCAGDYNNDGYVDLYVTNFGPNVLLRNRGDGTFEQVAKRAGVDDPGWGAGAAFLDADKDGLLDLYVVNYIDCTLDEVLGARRTSTWRNKAKTMAGPFGLRGGRDRFFHNNGDGTFTDATQAVGMTDDAEAYGLGVIASDLDNDGDIDVYVANDSNPNFLYRNEGDGKFSEIGGWCGAGFNRDGAAQAGMGAEAGDFDNDGLLDLFVTNFARDHCTLYRNTGELFFDDVTAQHQIKTATFAALSWGCAFADFDLDADLDLVQVNGHIYPQVDEYPEFEESYRQHPLLFRNDRGRFVNVVSKSGPGMDIAVSARGPAVADYDNDGDPDMVISTMDAPPLLLRNDSPRRGNWLKLRLLNRYGSPAIGARARITASRVTQLRELRSGSTYQSQNALELHFGLAGTDTIDRIEIRWPDGETSTLADQPANQTLVLREPPRAPSPNP